MEENLNDYVNESLKRLKSNNDIWESLLVDKRDFSSWRYLYLLSFQYIETVTNNDSFVVGWINIV